MRVHSILNSMNVNAMYLLNKSFKPYLYCYTLRTIMGNFALRLQQYVASNGRHLTETVLKK